MPRVAHDPREIVLGRVRELPPLPLVVQELLAVMRRPESSAEDITRVLSADQALAGKILRLVNSSFYGMPGHVGTISQAVVILGHAALRNLAMSLAVVDSIGRDLPAERRQVFWQHALATAAGAEVVARHAGLPEPEEAFVAGLLHGLQVRNRLVDALTTPLFLFGGLFLCGGGQASANAKDETQKEVCFHPCPVFALLIVGLPYVLGRLLGRGLRFLRT